MPRRPRTFMQEIRSIALQVIVIAVFVLLMLNVFLPWATQYMSDAALQQFVPSASPSKAP